MNARKLAAGSLVAGLVLSGGAHAQEPRALPPEYPVSEALTHVLKGVWVGTMREVENEAFMSACGDATVMTRMSKGLFGAVNGTYVATFLNPVCDQRSSFTITTTRARVVQRLAPNNRKGQSMMMIRERGGFVLRLTHMPDNCVLNLHGRVTPTQVYGRYTSSDGCGANYEGFINIKKQRERQPSFDRHEGIA